MTSAELNRKLAEALGWDMDEYGCVNPETNAWPFTLDFSPATDINHLRKYVLPEVEKRLGSEGISAFYEAVRQVHPSVWESSTDDTHGAAWDFLTAPPAVLAAAALKTLRGE